MDKKQLAQKKYYKQWRKNNWDKLRYNNFKGNCKKRKIENFITKLEFDEYLKLPCYYCNEKSTGLDRIDNNKGYQKDNILPCCIRCNHTRNVYWTVEETKKMITMILKYRQKKPKVDGFGFREKDWLRLIY